MPDPVRIPPRSQVRESDRWDLSSLFKDEDSWETGLKALDAEVAKISEFKGNLAASQAVFAGALDL